MSDMTEKKTRAPRSTKEQMIERLEAKIQDHEDAIKKHEEAIVALREEIEERKKPKATTKQYNDILKKAKDQGLTLEQIAEKLGIDL